MFSAHGLDEYNAHCYIAGIFTNSRSHDILQTVSRQVSERATLGNKIYDIRR